MLGTLDPALREIVEPMDRRTRQRRAHKTLFLLSEHLPVTLRSVVAGAGAYELPLATVAAVLGDVGEALLFLHHQRLVHMDLTLDSVAVAGDPFGGLAGGATVPRAVLTNFDHALRFPGDDLVMDRGMDAAARPEHFGNPEHMAPEVHVAVGQLQGANVRMDLARQAVFQLGVLVHEVCCGNHPITGYPGTLVWDAAGVDPLPERYGGWGAQASL
jgi:hypothetical protein